MGFERNDRRAVTIVTRACWDHPSARSSHSRTSRRATGQLCGLSDTADVVDASVVVVARQRSMRVVTSDTRELRRLDPALDVVAV